MKLIKKIFINNQEYQLISENIVVELDSPGRGIVVVKAEEALSGVVKFYLGYGEEMRLYFTGLIESCRQVDRLQQRITIREPIAALDKSIRISLRHVTAGDILAAVRDITGLAFTIEQADWNETILPHAINTGTGLDLLDWLGAELNIKKFVRLSQPDGSIYFGSWDGLPIGGITLDLPADMFTQVSSAGGTIQIVPKLRPGIRLCVGNAGQTFINKIEVSGVTMRCTFEENPWE